MSIEIFQLYKFSFIQGARAGSIDTSARFWYTLVKKMWYHLYTTSMSLDTLAKENKLKIVKQHSLNKIAYRPEQSIPWLDKGVPWLDKGEQ